MNELFHELKELIQSARKTVVHSVDLIQVVTNFEIGCRIVEYEQKGEKRAKYGKKLLKLLAHNLTNEFGRGFSKTNLKYMRRFFLSYQDRKAQIAQMISGQFLPGKKTQTASGQLWQSQKHRTTSADLAFSKKMQTPFVQFTLS